MCEDPDDLWKAMGLKYIEEFECFLIKMVMNGGRQNVEWRANHFKSKRSIDHQQHEIGNFANVNHAV